MSSNETLEPSTQTTTQTFTTDPPDQSAAAASTPVASDGSIIITGNPAVLEKYIQELIDELRVVGKALEEQVKAFMSMGALVRALWEVGDPTPKGAIRTMPLRAKPAKTKAKAQKFKTRRKKK